MGNNNSRLAIPPIESLNVENYRALSRVGLGGLTPKTELLGPNGSGKSTVFDIFNFLSTSIRRTEMKGVTC